MNVILLRSCFAVLLLSTASAVSAQIADESALDAFDGASRPTIPAIREPVGAVELRTAMRRISFNATDADALADAGNAALTLGDANAALNFFTRANTVRPNNGRIVAGLAAATVRSENPFEALRLFDDAIRLGMSDRTIAADRALAYDLLGNFERAQQDYRLARTAASSDDLVIRQAISLSLAGQKADADAMLVPFLQKNSASAWRARAFMLAARGDFREASKVTLGFMDAVSAQRMERFLRLMPELTAAQQAAAIHLGHFPAGAYVGRDSDQLRRVAAAISPAVPGPGESRLIPTGDPLGPKSANKVASKTEKKPDRKRDRRARAQEQVTVAIGNIPEANKLPKTDRSRLSTDSARAKIDEAQTARVASVSMNGLPPPANARPLVTVASPQQRQANTPLLPPVQPAFVPQSGMLSANTATVLPKPIATEPAMMTPIISAQPISVPTVTANGAPEITATTTVAMQGPVANEPAAAAVGILVPVPAPAAGPINAAVVAGPGAVPAFDLASIVSAIEIPESEQTPSAIPVDLTKIRLAKPKVAAVDAATKTAKLDPKIAAKAKLESANPARFWVQIATGDSDALGYDYRKWSKKSADLFKTPSGWTSAWGKTSRLLVGPFADMKSAKKWEGDFKKAGGDGFMWKSENGVVVTALKSK